MERARLVPFAPQAGRRCRQVDEGQPSAITWADVEDDAG
jgi:hypothetical protein